MREEILNADGTRNFQANILLDNVKLLEQENEQLKTRLKLYIKAYKKLQAIKEIAENQDILRGRQALATKILDIINKAEV